MKNLEINQSTTPKTQLRQIKQESKIQKLKSKQWKFQ